MDRGIYNGAALGYIGDPKKNVAKLLEYAAKRRVLNKVKERTEVWLLWICGVSVLARPKNKAKEIGKPL